MGLWRRQQVRIFATRTSWWRPNDRAQKQLKLGLRRATLNTTKAVETLDFQCNPTINRQQVLALEACDYIREHRNVLLCGPTGVGKSHPPTPLGSKHPARASVPGSPTPTRCYST